MRACAHVTVRKCFSVSVRAYLCTLLTLVFVFLVAMRQKGSFHGSDFLERSTASQMWQYSQLAAFCTTTKPYMGDTTTSKGYNPVGASRAASLCKTAWSGCHGDVKFGYGTMGDAPIVKWGLGAVGEKKLGQVSAWGLLSCQSGLGWVGICEELVPGAEGRV